MIRTKKALRFLAANLSPPPSPRQIALSSLAACTPPGTGGQSWPPSTFVRGWDDAVTLHAPVCLFVHKLEAGKRLCCLNSLGNSSLQISCFQSLLSPKSHKSSRIVCKLYSSSLTHAPKPLKNKDAIECECILKIAFLEIVLLPWCSFLWGSILSNGIEFFNVILY